LITEPPIQFTFRWTVVEYVKPRLHWATLHTVVTVFSDYSPVLVAENGDYIA